MLSRHTTSARKSDYTEAETADCQNLSVVNKNRQPLSSEENEIVIYA
jgi:hypothetical protein